MEQTKNKVAFVFEGNLNDLLVDNGEVKSSRLIEFGNETNDGCETNWDVSLTSYNNINYTHKRFDELLKSNVRITVEIID